MQRACEVCESLAKLGLVIERPKRRIRRVLVEERIVALCDEHVSELHDAGTSTIAEARQLFAEPDGRRSLVGRRSPLDRRIFPVRPEGRRRGGGRRGDDTD